MTTDGSIATGFGFWITAEVTLWETSFEVKVETLGLYELLEDRIERGLVVLVNELADTSSEGTWVDSD